MKTIKYYEVSSIMLSNFVFETTVNISYKIQK